MSFLCYTYCIVWGSLYFRSETAALFESILLVTSAISSNGHLQLSCHHKMWKRWMFRPLFPLKANRIEVWMKLISSALKQISSQTLTSAWILPGTIIYKVDRGEYFMPFTHRRGAHKSRHVNRIQDASPFCLLFCSHTSRAFSCRGRSSSIYCLTTVIR